MEKINMDYNVSINHVAITYNRRTWKIQAKLFKIHNLWRSSFKQLILECDAKILATFFFLKKYIYTPIIQLRIKTVAGHHNSHDVYYSETVYKLNVTQTVLSLWKTAREDLSFLDGFYCSFNVIITLWTAWNCFYPLIWTNISLASVFLRFLML